MVRSHISNCDGEKQLLLSSAKGFHLNSFDLLPSVGVLQLISNNLWPCESFDDLHKQCYLPITAGGGSREKIQRIIELASAAPQKMISNATFFNENRSTCHYLMPSMKMPVPHKAPNSPKRFTNQTQFSTKCIHMGPLESLTPQKVIKH